jgi:DNA-binding FadR family transcriptional regulator
MTKQSPPWTTTVPRSCRFVADGFDALRDRDPDDAGEAMRRHLQNVSDNLLGRH